MYLVVSGISGANLFLASGNLWQIYGHQNLCCNSCKLRHLFQYPPHCATSSDPNSTSTTWTKGRTFIIRRLKKSAFNTFLVFIFLLICSWPFLYVYFNNGVSITVLYIARIMISLNASFNPFLYSWRLREIRSATKQIFCRS